MRNFLLLLFTLVIRISLPAQTGEQYFFTQYTAQNGLVSNQARAMVQDGDGYIWLGTADGLQRFDGVRFKTWLPNENDPAAVPGKNIVQLLQEDPYHFWILTDNYQLGLFDTKTFRFSRARLLLPDSSAHAFPGTLIKDEYGNLMFLWSKDQLLTYNQQKNEFSEAHNLFRIKGKNVLSIAQKPGTKQYWLGTDKGIVIYDGKTKQFCDSANNFLHEPLLDILAGVSYPSNFLFDSKGRFWCDYWKPSPYIFCYDYNTQKVLLDNYDLRPVFRSYFEIKGFIEQSDGTIWVRGLKLLGRYNAEDNKVDLVKLGGPDNEIQVDQVTQLMEDRDENLWVVTNNKGIIRFNPGNQVFKNIPHLNPRNQNRGDGSVMSFALTKDGNLLSGCWDDGLFLYNRQLKEIPITHAGLKASSNRSVWGMYPSHNGKTIWMASQPGILDYDQHTGKLLMYDPPVMAHRTVRQVLEDRQGNLWIGMHNYGLFRWNATDKDNRNIHGIQRISAIKNCSVNQLSMDRQGNIWVATNTEGFWCFEPGGSIKYHGDNHATNQTKQIGNAISSILDYGADSILIGSANHLYIYQPSRTTVKQIKNSAAFSGYICSTIKDVLGFVWIATSNGIYRLNLSNESFLKFDNTDGIQDIQFTVSAAFAMPDNRILFGSTEIVAFNPLAIKNKQKQQPVRITDFIVQNNPLLVDSIMQLKQVQLAPGENSLVIEFSTLDFSPSHSIIKYKLEGIDKDWKYNDNSYRAVYSYLPPGNYTFLITSEDADAIPSEHTTRLYIEVKAHFWQTWWFYGLLILVAATLFYWFDRERMRRKEDILSMRENIAGNLHQEINTALGNINILSEMARRKADKDPEKSKDYIEQIHAKSSNMMYAMDDMLWSIDPANDSMQRTLERITEFTEALEKEKGIETELWVDQKVSTVTLNMKLRYEAFQLLKEVLKSLDDNGRCKVHVGLENNALEFIIQYENQVGQMEGINSLAQKTDFQKRLQTAHAAFDVQVHQGHGLVELQIPVR